MGGRARHHPGRAAWPAGAGPGGEARGGRRAALHLAGRRPAPPPARADQRARLRARGVAWTALGRCRRQHRGAQRDRARGRDVRPRSSGPPSPRVATRSTTTARSSSSRRTPVGSASARHRSTATSTGTKPHGAPSTPARSPGRDCAVPGTDARGRTRGPTRSCPAAAPTSSPHGTTNCATSASPHRPPHRPTGDRAGSADRSAQPRRRRRPRAHPARRQAVGMERSRHPRRGRTTDRLRRRRRRTSGPARAGRGHRRPCPDTVRAAAGPR